MMCERARYSVVLRKLYEFAMPLTAKAKNSEDN